MASVEKTIEDIPVEKRLEGSNTLFLWKTTPFPNDLNSFSGRDIVF
ncbi:MAG: hypothetical protein QNK37_23130 [Acidobacteriota bacterium]|nr:hypothetical protein [Acidobacteriota bacterium]